ncbi:MAG: hypothetical protein WDW38_002733 [Sanguina aurantia]
MESLVEAAVLDSDGLSFEDFVKLLRSGSIDGTSSSTAALEIYDPRVSSVHRGRLAEEAGLVAAQQQQQQQQASPMSPTASCAGMSVGGNGEHLTEGDGSHTLLTTLFSGGRTSPTEDEDEDDEDFNGAGDDSEEEERAGPSKPVSRSGGSQKPSGGSKPAPAKRRKRSELVDDAAEEDDDEEEDGGLLIDDGDVAVAGEAAGNAAAAVAYRRQHKEADERSAEEMAAYIEEKYRDLAQRGEEDEDDGGTVGQQGLNPTPNDPKLWLVTVRPGMERMVAVQLMQKFAIMKERGTPLMIKSVVALDHLKGYVYVESEKESYVKDAIRGIRTAFTSRGAQLVPLKEMVDAITVNRKARQRLAKDTWVRMRMGLYKEDLAKVVDVDYAASKATIHILHRLDFQAMANRDDETRVRLPFGRAPLVRPPARVFNLEEARQAQLMCQRMNDGDGMTVVQVNSHRFHGGYLEKVVAIKSLLVQEILPPLDEIARFNSAAAHDEEGGDAGTELSSLMSALAQKGGEAGAQAKFSKGDKVLIKTGDLANLDAIVTEVLDDGRVMVLPAIKGFTESVDYDAADLRKSFKVGSRVKVLVGQHLGETGMLLSVSDDLCYVLSDSNKQQISVFARDLSEAVSIDTGVEQLGNYCLHDVVQLEQTVAGIIVRVQHDTVQVMVTGGTPHAPTLRLCRLADIQRKLTCSRASVTMDSLGNMVYEGDVVFIKDGPLANKAGTVKHVWRRSLFIHSVELRDHGGYTVVDGSGTRKQGAQQNITNTSSSDLAAGILGGSRSGTPMSPMGQSPFTYRSSPHPGQLISGAGAGGRGGGVLGGGRGRGRGGRGYFVDKTVRVVGGQYTGYKGRVKHETATHVQLEMDAISRVITIPIALIKELDSSGKILSAYAPPGMSAQPGSQFGSSQPGSYNNPSQQNGGSQFGSYRPPSSAPMGSATPMHPSMMTPSHNYGSSTPMHAPYTPAHAPYTPAHPSAADAYDERDDRGRGSHHHHHSGGGGDGYRDERGNEERDHFGSAPTPGNFVAMTPSGYTPSDAYPSAPTPRDYGPSSGLAATPQIAGTPYLSAPTPNLVHDSAPTPGHYDSHPANTPGGEGGMQASTPGLPAQTPAFTPGTAYTPGTPGEPYAAVSSRLKMDLNASAGGGSTPTGSLPDMCHPGTDRR